MFRCAPCGLLESSGARCEAFRTIAGLAPRYARHPALWGWLIDSESSYAEDTESFSDFNPNFLNDGHRWLRGRYGTLARLNRACFAVLWSQSANVWSQV